MPESESDNPSDAKPVDPVPGPGATRSFKQAAISGSMWTMIGHGGAEGLRLGGHLIVAYLLGPEALGIMFIVNVVIRGLKMFSDLGVGASVIQHPRGNERTFLNTAWTLQVIRGSGLFLFAGLACIPIAIMREAPIYYGLLPLAAVGALLDGARSTARTTLHRHMNFATLELSELSRRMIAVTSTVVFAFLFERVWSLPINSVWALPIGATIGAIYAFILSHTLIEALARKYGDAPPGRNWFAWDRDALKHLVRFGKWIFLATALTYLCGQGDRIVLTGFLTETELGIYGVAVLLATAVQGGLRRVGMRVLFPILSRVAEQSPEKLKANLRRARRPLHMVALPIMCALAIFGDRIVNLLYTEEFRQAGPILCVLAMGSIFRIITTTASPVILASGDSFRHMIRLVAEAIILIFAMAIGGMVGGYFGAIVGIAATPLLSYPVHAWAVAAHNAWMPRFDFGWMIGCAIVILIGSLLFS